MKVSIHVLLFANVLFSLSAFSQIISDSILVDGNYRSFHFLQPTASTKDASLVFILHGSGGNGRDMMSKTNKLSQQALKENALLIYPDGYKKYWNECRKEASSLANKEDVDENTFFDSMIKYFKANYQINDRHVFAVGTSGGGHMCYKLALTMPEKFGAIAALIANLPAPENLDCAEAKTAIPVMIVNSTTDPVNPYEGGMMDSPSFKMGRVRSTDKTFQYWAALAGYGGDAVKELLPDTDPSDGKTIERYTYKQGAKPEIVLLKVIGGKHDYPNDIDVHIEAWEFFKRQMSGDVK